MKYLTTMLVMFCLMAVTKAKAGTDKEFMELMADKDLVYNGVCSVRKDGTLTFKNEEKKYTVRCLVGMVLPDQSKHYVVYLDHKNIAIKVILYDEATKKETTLWMRGTGV